MDNLMDPKKLAGTLREAFGERFEMPLVFGYCNEPAAQTEKAGGCMFKVLDHARKGNPVALSIENVACGGGKFYAGFTPPADYICNFVSQKERYKSTPEMMQNYLAWLDLKIVGKPYLNFVRLDMVQTLEGMEGLLFYATPDVLSGLATWAFFDNNDPDAVSAPFGSGCCSAISMAVRENRLGGRRTFIGLFDPSVRPWVGPNELSFVIPRVRFAEMQHTLRSSCLFDTAAWPKVRARFNGQSQ